MSSGPWEKYQDGPWSKYREAPTPEPTLAEKAGANLREIPRQFGLTGRHVLEAFGQTALPDMLNLPIPQNANERVVGDASRILVGAGGIAKGAQVAGPLISKAAHPILSGITEAFAANLPAQASGAVGAGLAGGSVREAGGGPTEQFIASVLGGVAAGVATQPTIRAVNTATESARRMVAPRDIQGTITVELQKAGIDWNALSNQAKIQLVKDAEKATLRGEPLDRAALARLADYRNIGATPLRGDITQNPRDITLQRNLAKTQANMSIVPGKDISMLENENARTVLRTIDNIAPSADDAYAAGAKIQAPIQAKDAGYKATEDALYKSARKSFGRDIPLDRATFVKEAFDNLERSNRAAFLPGQVKTVLNQFSQGKGQFTVDTIDNLKTMLAAESRKAARAGDGNTVRAIAEVRNALENVRPAVAKQATGSQSPIPGDMGARLAQRDKVATDVAGETLGKFDAARATARERRTWQESAKFIEDALEGQDPEKFVKANVVNAEFAELQRLRGEIGRAPEALTAVRAQIIEHIKRRGSVDPKVVQFSSKGMDDALRQIGDRKLALFFSKDEIQQLRSAVNVARYSQAQPIGSAVNNSNSGAMMIGKIFDAIIRSSTNVPVIGPLVSKPIAGAQVALQSSRAANIPNALLTELPPNPLVPVNALAAFAITPRGND